MANQNKGRMGQLLINARRIEEVVLSALDADIGYFYDGALVMDIGGYKGVREAYRDIKSIVSGGLTSQEERMKTHGGYMGGFIRGLIEKATPIVTHESNRP